MQLLGALLGLLVSPLPPARGAGRPGAGARAGAIEQPAKRSLGSWRRGTATPSRLAGLTLEKERNFHRV